jgi:cytochrome c oxidase subunit 3
VHRRQRTKNLVVASVLQALGAALGMHPDLFGPGVEKIVKSVEWWVLAPGLLIILATMFWWWSDVIAESRKYHRRACARLSAVVGMACIVARRRTVTPGEFDRF